MGGVEAEADPGDGQHDPAGDDRCRRQRRPRGDRDAQVGAARGQHAAVVVALQVAAERIRAEIRNSDTLARWGGDEFLVLVYPTDQQHLDSLGERLRAAIASSRAVLDAKGQPLAMSVSIGGYVANPGEELDHVLQAGDEALYAAKEAGRNAYRAAG